MKEWYGRLAVRGGAFRLQADASIGRTTESIFRLYMQSNTIILLHVAAGDLLNVDLEATRLLL